MPILPSRAQDIHKWLGRLSSESAAERDAAIARLTLLGPRALEPLQAVLRGAGPARLAAMAVVEALRDPRALPDLLRLAADPDTAVARRAIEAVAAYNDGRAARALARSLPDLRPEARAAAASGLARLYAAGAVEALEPILDVLLDEDEDEATRLAAASVLRHLEPRERSAVAARLRHTRNAALGARLRAVPLHDDAGDPAALVETLVASSGNPELALKSAQALRACGDRAVEPIHRALESTERLLPLRLLAETLGHFGAPASIPALHRLIERLSRRARDAGDEAAAVAEVKAAAHLALAALGSRIALYDLREMLEVPSPLAVLRLLEAASAVGDATVVPALAALAAYDRTLTPACARAFGAIVSRERLTRRSRALRGVKAEHRAALEELWAALPKAR
jgi:HEAT repeat protein